MPPWLGEGKRKLTPRLVRDSCHISKRGARCLAALCLRADDFGSHCTIQVFPQFSPETEGVGIWLRRHDRYGGSQDLSMYTGFKFSCCKHVGSLCTYLFSILCSHSLRKAYLKSEQVEQQGDRHDRSHNRNNKS